MHIAYDHHAFSWQEYGGISRYFWEVALRMSDLGAGQVSIVAPLYVNRYLGASRSVRIVGTRIKKLRGTTGILRNVNNPLTSALLRGLRPTVVHETYYGDRRLAPASAATVVTVFDMTHERLPEYFSAGGEASRLKHEAVQRADRVICISQNTQQDLVELFGVAEEKTSVVHLGCSLSTDEHSDTPRVIPEPYLGFVGYRGAYKNYAALLEAYASSDQLRNNFKLVCFGGAPLTGEELATMARLGIQEDRVVVISGDDATLASFYRHAEVFVCPSKYEGFGLTTLEAMSQRCPVACSHNSSLPEVCGEAAAYFDPEDVDSIRDTIERVVDGPELRDELTTEGIERVQHFTWDRCAAGTSEVYTSL